MVRLRTSKADDCNPSRRPPYRPHLTRGLDTGNSLDLDLRSLRQRDHLEGGANGIGLGEELRVDLIHGTELVDVGQEDGGLDDVAHGGAGSLKDVLDVGEALASLTLDIRSRKLVLKQVECWEFPSE